MIELLLKAGADPNYEYTEYKGTYRRPVGLAASRFDVPLLSLLVKHGARLDRSFPACKNPSKNTLLSQLPRPADGNVDTARIFLNEYIKLGGDITATQNDCTSSYTLKSFAIDEGQVRYAEMVLELEKQQGGPRTAPTPSPGAVVSPAPAETPQPSTVKIKPGQRVLTTAVNVREQPSAWSALLGVLPPETDLQVTGSSADGQWSRVATPDGVNGWVFNPVLAKGSNVVALPPGYANP